MGICLSWVRSFPVTSVPLLLRYVHVFQRTISHFEHRHHLFTSAGPAWTSAFGPFFLAPAVFHRLPLFLSARTMSLASRSKIVLLHFSILPILHLHDPMPSVPFFSQLPCFTRCRPFFPVGQFLLLAQILGKTTFENCTTSFFAADQLKGLQSVLSSVFARHCRPPLFHQLLSVLSASPISPAWQSHLRKLTISILLQFQLNLRQSVPSSIFACFAVLPPLTSSSFRPLLFDCQ